MQLTALVRQLRPSVTRGATLPQVWLQRRWMCDTHDDFKPKYHAEPIDDIEQTIKKDIADNGVFVYMKGTPEAPMCGFSKMACTILNAYGVEYGARDVLSDPGVREGIKKFTGWPTIPQVFVKGEFVGGSDILLTMHNDGELEKLFASVSGKA